MRIHDFSIEPLEPRIAPATLVGNVLTYTDLDGDVVKVTFTKATMAPADFFFSTGTANDGVNTPRLLVIVDLSGMIGAGFTLVATPHDGKGESHANVGTIFSNDDMGTVKVDGDVEAIGGSSMEPAGLKSFSALSVGLGAQAGSLSYSYLGSVGLRTARVGR